MRSKLSLVISGVVLASLSSSIAVGQAYLVSPQIAHNRWFLRYANSQIGKKVGGGGSTQFIEAALAATVAKTPSDTKQAFPEWGTRKSTILLLPGQIIQFENCVFKSPDGKTTISFSRHTAIVTNMVANKVGAPRGRTVKLLHQDLEGDISKSVVRETELDLGWHTAGEFRNYSPQPVHSSGSAITAKEQAELLELHNKARKEVGVAPVEWLPDLADFAQEWADQLAESGELKHRPVDGPFAQKYGENWAVDSTVLKGGEAWYSEIKFYVKGTPIPSNKEDFKSFKAGHYTQMVWRKSTLIGAGKAIIKKGPYKGRLVVVCNYRLRGNTFGEKPF